LTTRQKKKFLPKMTNSHFGGKIKKMALGEFDDSDDDFETTTDISTAVEESQDDSDDDNSTASADGDYWMDEPPAEHVNADDEVYYEEFRFTGTPGPLHSVSTVYDDFRLFLSDEILELITSETNRMRCSMRKRKRGNADVAVDGDEMMVFIAVTILTEIHGKKVLRHHWSTDNYLRTPIFSQLMSRDRYEAIASWLHFEDDSAIQNRQGAPVDKFAKIRRLFDMFNERFSACYELDRSISVDESLLLWKGHHSLKRYIPFNIRG
jgi:hypothetical protein